MAVLAIVLAAVGIALLRHRIAPSLHPATRAYLLFCERLERLGLERERYEAPGTFARRVAQLRPDIAAETLRITRFYESIVYGGRETADIRRELDRLVARFRPAPRPPSSAASA
jgi:hypothetical protein